MILGVLIGFAALAVVSSVIGDGESETYDPVTDEGGLNVIGSDQDDLLSGNAGDDLAVASAVVEQTAVVDPVATTDPDQPGRIGLTELARNMRAEADNEGNETLTPVQATSLTAATLRG